MKLRVVFFITVMSLMCVKSFAQPATTDSQSTKVCSWLGRLGLGADLLCAAGVEGTSLAGLIAQAHATSIAGEESLANADRECNSARAALRALAADRDMAPEAREQAISQAQVRIKNADLARSALIQAARSTILAALSTSQKQQINTALRNAHRKIPLPYLLVDRTPESWDALDKALRQERTAASTSTALGAEAQQLLASAHAEPAVAQARVRLENLAAYRSAFNAMVSALNAAR